MKARMRALLLSAVLTGVVVVAPGAQGLPNYRPKDGYVPNAATAVAIAEAVLSPIYGQAETVAERPYRAILDNGVWTVRGTVPCPSGGCGGGTGVVWISKDDGRIVRVYHEQ